MKHIFRPMITIASVLLMAGTAMAYLPNGGQPTTAQVLLFISDSADGLRGYADTTTATKLTGHTTANQQMGSATIDTSITLGGTAITSTATELNYDHNTTAIRATSPTRLIAITTTIQVVSTNATIYTLAAPAFAGHVEKIVVGPGATLAVDAGGVTIAITKTGGVLLTLAATVDLTSGGQSASTAHAEALNGTASNLNIAATNEVYATLATDGTVTTAGTPYLITIWYSLDNP